MGTRTGGASNIGGRGREQCDPWTGTPLTVELQPADEAQEGAADEVDIAPQQLQLTPDSIGQDYGTVHIVNQSAEEQVVIVSAQLPETIALYVIQDEPHSATLPVRWTRRTRPRTTRMPPTAQRCTARRQAA